MQIEIFAYVKQQIYHGRSLGPNITEASGLGCSNLPEATDILNIKNTFFFRFLKSSYGQFELCYNTNWILLSPLSMLEFQKKKKNEAPDFCCFCHHLNCLGCLNVDYTTVYFSSCWRNILIIFTHYLNKDVCIFFIKFLFYVVKFSCAYKY